MVAAAGRFCRELIRRGGLGGRRCGGLVAAATVLCRKAVTWLCASRKRRFLLAVVVAAIVAQRGIKADELVAFSAPACPGGITITSGIYDGTYVIITTSAGDVFFTEYAGSWYNFSGSPITRAHVVGMANGYPMAFSLPSSFTSGVTPNYAYVACQANASNVPDSCCGHFLCVNGTATEITCESPCTPYDAGCVFIPGFYFPPTWYACDGFGDCGGGGPGDPCAPYGGDGDADGTCAQFDCCDSDPAVGATCPACYQFCVQHQDGDGDGCCSNRDCNDADASVCSFCSGPGPGACDDYGGDADGDGCCANTDIDDSDPLQCAGGPPPPPTDCTMHGGDGDMDGCCGDDDFDDGDPNVCEEPTPGECDRLGGDGDEDGCCADIDVDDGDPEVCEECDNKGGDGDGDGCCDQDDTHPNDPEKGCACMVDGEQQDADADGCCTADDSDDDDPEKGCQCECEVDPMERLDEISEKIAAWWPPFDDLVEAASTGSFQSGAATGETIFSTTLHLPFDFGGVREIEVPLTLNPAEWPSGLAATFGWLVDYVRSALLVYFLTTFCFAILGLMGIL